MDCLRRSTMITIGKKQLLSTVDNRRLDYIDLIKGFGSLLVVIGHMQYSPFMEDITKFIYGFHMPMFFWISGYLYKKPTRLIEYFRRKTRSLLVPWMCFGFFYLLVTLLVSGEKAFFDGLVGLLYKVVRDVPVEIGLWFLPVMFLTCVSYTVIDIFISRQWVKYILFGVITVIGCEWTKYFHYLPFGISSMMPCLGFFAFGVWFRKKADGEMKGYIKSHRALSFFVCLVSIVAFGYLIMLNDKVSVRLGEYGIPILGWGNAMAFTLIIFFLSLIFCHDTTNANGTDKHKILSPLTCLGNSSLVVLCVNHPVLNLSLSILKKVGFEAYSYTIFILHFLLSMLLIIVLIWAFKVTPLKRIAR